jgi:hypothetical protein
MTTTTIARVAKFFPRGVDTFLREGTLNADRQVAGEHTEKSG